MADRASIPPARRPDLFLGPPGEDGQRVVKDLRARSYFSLGGPEAFLLEHLDGRQTVGEICDAFEKHFGQPLGPEDLDNFVALARQSGFLSSGGAAPLPAVVPAPAPVQPSAPAPYPDPPPPTRRRPLHKRLLYWRKSLFDPDRLLNWLEPKIRFVWTGVFLVASLAAILLAAVLVGMDWREMISHFAGALRWETLVLVWLTVVVVTLGHELAHGLTCKHHGGEVHEIGFLLIFFIPCFYCNVSDAWLIREKWKRLWITLAGAYFDLCVWAAAVIIWRLTPIGTLTNYLAWVVLTVCSTRVFFNFNPLMKLDGYYLLSDWLEIPNLRKRSWARVASYLRWVLWGASRPESDPRNLTLLTYGLSSWVFSMMYLSLMVTGLVLIFGMRWGVAGVGAAGALGMVLVPGMFTGLLKGELMMMLLRRHVRTAFWVLALAGVAAALYFVHIEDRVGGSFQVRPAGRAELRATVPGFLRTVYFDEGDRVSVGDVVALLEVPDLASRIAQKRAEVREVQARLQLLEAGPRAEEVAEQRARVDRARSWRVLAQEDLERARKSFRETIARLEEQINQARTEMTHAQTAYSREEKLYARGVVGKADYEARKKDYELAHSRLDQAQAQKEGQQVLGTLEAERELARREKDLADVQGTLALLLAGTRPEAIEAERAHLARLQEEANYLQTLQEKLEVRSPIPGIITTPRIRERPGQYLREGDLIATIENPGTLHAEISLHEQDLARVQPGQMVELKPRVLPFLTLQSEVQRLAPRTGKPEAERSDRIELVQPLRSDENVTLTVYCQVENGPPELRPGMSGYARIYCGQRRIGAILLDRALRFLRTEFWW